MVNGAQNADPSSPGLLQGEESTQDFVGTHHDNYLESSSSSQDRSSIDVAPQMFSDIYAQTLPVLLSAGEIPSLLRSMHCVLKPLGTLHLILMDPLPVEATLGPRMRAWLEEHLLINLERQFRCVNPTTQFLPWLRDAHFQLGEGDKVVSRFPAALPDVSGDSSISREVSSVKLGNGKGKEKADKNEQGTNDRQLRLLHNIVGQKLWQDIWGSYVTADRWWWEDALCREECLRLETAWEYHILGAVKKSMAPGGGRN
ncbi:hypothetical protein CMQ_6072 [Grosmannia clavigera kw1407]|uniref:Uncharacterized protein n=1 Tax=Grosmannia clavigera (strain kw1407 / UAMH 11150) TaxID=655863 RepID=F0XM14_GROCL|nr:uncharacterized protein CMQ_6072 [Grosmannia clavigera kw1407]EFX01130.1 hypothetical protein CMQ_6072 [Grosmannia clavigera kw1407]